ncbi:MAG: hypothetical protein JW941_12785 [Candidatus Coatesbacteria bacterium]|nr:hypothetical protein [Candidatus Coatesbacteria bacterium]
MLIDEYCSAFLRDECEISGSTDRLLNAMFKAARQLIPLLNLEGQGIQDLLHHHIRVLDDVDPYFGPAPPIEHCFRAIEALGFGRDQVRRIRFVPKAGTSTAYASALNIDEDLRVVGNLESGAIWYRILTHEVGHLLGNTFSPRWPSIVSDPIFPYWGELLAELPSLFASTAPVLQAVLEIEGSEAAEVAAAMRRSKAIEFIIGALRAEFSIEVWRDASSSFDEIYHRISAIYGLAEPEPNVFFPPAIKSVTVPLFVHQAFGACVAPILAQFVSNRATKLWQPPIVAPLLIGELYPLWSKRSVVDYLLDNGCELTASELIDSLELI